jgi:hypothetical protein
VPNDLLNNALKRAVEFFNPLRTRKFMRKQVIFEYNIDYEKARCEASKLANEVIRAHPKLKYKIVTSPGEGAFI